MNTSTPEYTATVKSTQPYNYTPPMPPYPDVTDSKAVNSESFNTSQSEYSRDGGRPLPSAIVGSSSSNSNASTPKKRTRATPEQLAVLEKTFMTNTSPNSRMRTNLAQELGMTERSIQIWFQNRRAKVKNMAKRAAILQEEAMRAQFMAASGYMPFYPPAYPSRQAHHYRPPVLPHHFRRARSSSDVMGAVRERARMRAHSVGGGLLNQMQNDMMPPPTATPWSSHFSPYHQQQPHYQPSPQPTGPEIDIADRHVMIGSGMSLDFFPASTLTIGTWKRMRIQSADLLCHYSLPLRRMIWHIQEQQRFKIEFPFDVIDRIVLVQDGELGRMDIQIRDPMNAVEFYMETGTLADGSIQWTQCRDFTEGREASQQLIHSIEGHAMELSKQLTRLASVELSLGPRMIIDSIIPVMDDPARDMFLTPGPSSSMEPEGYVDTTSTLSPSTTPTPTLVGPFSHDLAFTVDKSHPSNLPTTWDYSNTSVVQDPHMPFTYGQHYT
ncbi:hypothetical protein BC943DRAFT_320787 [Umbelopsis sp. AD052]|nr:hypothetical protein BC943DRAFT_320787 [Umbelopsis sp. AD052]